MKRLPRVGEFIDKRLANKLKQAFAVLDPNFANSCSSLIARWLGPCRPNVTRELQQSHLWFVTGDVRVALGG